MAFFGFLILALFSMTNSIQGQAQKIRVVVKNASIRISPNMDGEVLNNPNIGSVFDVVKKTDEWFEIKVTSRVGIEVSGYIHEMFVELIGDQPELEVKREPDRNIIDQPPMPAVQRQKKTSLSSEFVLMFRYPFGYKLNDTSALMDEWSSGAAELIRDDVIISHQFKNPLGFGVAFNQRFLGGLGVQLRLDMNSKAFLTDDSVSDYTLTWKFYGQSQNSLDDQWPIEGEASLMILSFNVFYKILGLGMVSPHFSGGISYSTGKMKLDTTSAVSLSSTYWEGDELKQSIDWLPLPFSIDAKTGGLGFNIGGGIDINLMQNLAVGLAARYFYVPKIEEEWQIPTGEFTSANFDFTWVVTENLIDYIREIMGPLVFEPSFFNIVLLFKFMF